MAIVKKYKDELKVKKRKRFVFKFFLFLSLLVLVAACISYLLFFRDFFNVTSVDIKSPENLRSDLSNGIANWLDVGSWKFTRRNNILFLSKDGLKKQLLSQISRLDSVDIKTDSRHDISVEATERKPTGVWCQYTEDNCFYFDKNGIAYSQAKRSSGFLLANITDSRQRDIKIGDSVAVDDWFKNITLSRDLLAKIDVNVLEIVIPVDSFNEFEAITVGGYKVLFSNSTDIAKQISSLAELFKQKLSVDKIKTLEYIDLRIQDRIYYK